MLYTHIQVLLCWLRLSRVFCVCVCVCVCLFCDAGDGGENPAFWYIPVRWREYLLYQVDPEHPGTTKTHTDWVREKVKELLSPVLNTINTHSNPVPLLSLGGNVTRTETFNGAIVSGTWPDPDPFYTTKPLEVCQSHTRTHTDGDGQLWCYSGANLNFIHAALGITS